MSITIKDISKATGKSYPTVSRALNNDPRISESTRALIRQTAMTLGYTRNKAARLLKEGKTGIIGICLPSPQGYFYAELAAGLHQAVTRHGYSPIFSFWSSVSEEATATHNLLTWNPEGIITIAPEHIPDQTTVPVVSYYNEDSRYDCVRFTIREAYDHVTSYVRKLGHRAIGWLGIPSDPSRFILQRLAEQKGLAYQTFFTTDPTNSHDDQSTREDIVRRLKCPSHPTALVASSDMLAMDMISRMASQGIRCPEDISVIGFDDLLISACISPPLTTYSRHIQQELAPTLVDRIVQRIAHPDSPRTITELAFAFIERDSVAACPPTSQPALSAVSTSNHEVIKKQYVD